VQYLRLGHPRKALEVLNAMVREHNRPGSKGRLINTYRLIIQQYVNLGEFKQATAALRSIEGLMQELRKGSSYRGFLRATWECDAEFARALLFDAHGQFHEAELAYRRAEALRRESIRERETYVYPPPVPQLQQAADMLLPPRDA
jgi:hypothetical protein